jgi:hypothetical protein
MSDIRACNQEHQADGREENIESCTDISVNLNLQRHRPDSATSVRVGGGTLQAPENRIDLRLDFLQTYILSQSPDCLPSCIKAAGMRSVIAIGRRIFPIPVGRNRSPELSISRRELEGFRHDTDHPR